MSWEVCKVGVAMVKTINFFFFKTDRDVEVLIHGTAQCGSALYSMGGAWCILQGRAK